MQRHQRLQRMRPGFDERAHVFAHEASLADVDHLLRGGPLLAVQLVLLGHAVEVVDDSLSQLLAVARLEQQLVQAIRCRRRVLVEHEALVLELEAAELSLDVGHNHVAHLKGRRGMARIDGPGGRLGRRDGWQGETNQNEREPAQIKHKSAGMSVYRTSKRRTSAGKPVYPQILRICPRADVDE